MFIYKLTKIKVFQFVLKAQLLWSQDIKKITYHKILEKVKAKGFISISFLNLFSNPLKTNGFVIKFRKERKVIKYVPTRLV